MEERVPGYFTGTQEALTDQGLLRQVRMRRRQLGQMMRAYDDALAQAKIPEATFHISRKVDGEYSAIIFDGEEAFTLNPGGTVRFGAPCHVEVASILKKAGIKSAMLGAELYAIPEGDAKKQDRPRVFDVVRIARNPQKREDVDRLRLALFNVYELDGEDLSMHYDQAIDRLQDLFATTTYAHPVDTVVGDKKKIFERFNAWVVEGGEEGVVVRSDALGMYKIKQRHNFDLAIIGFSTGVDDRANMLHSILLAVVRNDGSYQLLGRCGGGFSDEERVSLLKTFEPLAAESDFAEVNSERIAYQMIRPELVAEISCLDLVGRTSHGGTIDRMVLSWDKKKSEWEGLRRLPLCSIYSPQFERIRDDKTPSEEHTGLGQLTEITEIPEVDRGADALVLPTSTVMQRLVATKTLRGAMMVRKLLMWETNKKEADKDFPDFVVHLTDFSPNRKKPLMHDIKVSDSREQIEDLFEEWRDAKMKVRGWTILGEDGEEEDAE